MAGKWHLGHDDFNIPGARGFEKSFSMLCGGASHFSDMSGLVEVENPVPYSMNGKKIKELPSDFYSTRSYTDFLIKSIRESKVENKPFFAYLSYTAPHDPLQVTEPWMSKYQGFYDKGYEALRNERIQRTKELGLIPKESKIPKMHNSVPSWNSLTDTDKAYESRKMEVYAGMIENVDYHLGRMLDFLADIQELDNTIVLFLSDNGSNPWVETQYPGNSDGVYLSRFENKVDNLGNPTSHISYGIGWATACSGPLDYFKMTVGEGGIRTPLIMVGPRIPTGQTHNNFVYVTDIMPTILEMAGVEHPETYNGNEVLPMRGKSMAKLFKGEVESVYKPEEYIGGEMGNGKWMRKGIYKAEKVTSPYGNNEWKLYDLSNDPGETTDISESHQDLLEELINAWEQYAKDVGVVLRKD